uniref:Uncharacterized protein n=1 Tax=Cacopsylla melanoneura TaxID=428564 RepID=A0A8D8TT68_9HEMI
MVGPDVGNNGRSEGSGRVHAGTSEVNSGQMSKSNSQSNSKGSRGSGVRFVAVANTEDNQNKDEAKEEFNSHSLGRGEAGVQGGQTKVTLFVYWCQSLQNQTSRDSSNTLSDNVEDSSDDAHFTGG